MGWLLRRADQRKYPLLLFALTIIYSTNILVTQEHDFPDPFTVKPDRPRANYAVQGIGFHGCPGVDYAEKTLVEVIRVIFGLKNVRRAPGTMGTLSSFEDQQFGTKSTTFVDPTGNVTPWPGSLIIAYD